MKRLVTASSAIALLVASVPSQQRSLDRIFPESTYAVALFAGLDGGKNAAEGMRMFSLGKRTLERAGLELEGLAGDDLQHAIRDFARGLAEVGLDAASLRSLLRGDCALGVGRPTLQFFGMPSMLLAVDIGNRGREFGAAQDRLETLLAHHAPRLGIEWGSERFGDTEIRRIHARKYSALVTYATIDGLFLVATGDGYLKDCIRTLRGKGRSIRDNATYRNARQKHRVRPLASLFVNCQPVCRMLAPLMPYEAPALGESLGIEQLDGLYWATGTDAGGSDDMLFVAARGDERGALKALFHRPCSMHAATICPADTVLFASASFDSGALVDAVRRIVRHLPPELRRELEKEFKREVIRELDRELRQVGLKLRDVASLLEHVGSEVSLAMQMPLKQGPVPGMYAFVRLENPSAAEEQLMARLGRLLDGVHGPQLRTRNYQGHRIHFASVRAGVQLTPAFTIVGNTLVFSPLRPDLERLLSGMTKGEPRLADTPAFRKTIENTGPASMFLTVRLGVAMERGWPMARGQLTGMLRRFAPDHVDPNAVPTTEEMAQAFDNVTVSAFADREGFLVRQRHPIGLGTMLALAAWGADWFLAKTAAKMH